MRMGQSLRRAFLIVLLLAGGASSALVDDPPQPDPDALARRILDDWQRRSSEWLNLDVSFTGRDRSQIEGEDKPFSGRVVLMPRGRGLVEIVKLDGEGKPAQTVRTIWADEAMHQVRLDRKEHLTWPIAAKDRGRLPAVLALPFFWNLSVEGLKSRYRVELIKEDAATWALRITPISDAGRESFSKAYLQLDRETYLPRRYLVSSPDGKTSKDYRVTEARCNQSIPEEVLQIPDLFDWKVIRPDEDWATAWLFQWFKPDLLP